MIIEKMITHKKNLMLTFRRSSKIIRAHLTPKAEINSKGVIHLSKPIIKILAKKMIVFRDSSHFQIIIKDIAGTIQNPENKRILIARPIIKENIKR